VTGGERRGGEGRKARGGKKGEGRREWDVGPAGWQVPGPSPHWQKTGLSIGLITP